MHVVEYDYVSDYFLPTAPTVLSSNLVNLFPKILGHHSQGYGHAVVMEYIVACKHVRILGNHHPQFGKLITSVHSNKLLRLANQPD